MNYSSTAVGFSAQIIITNDTSCYDGDDSDMMRMCQTNEEWDGEMVENDDIAEGNLVDTLVGNSLFLYTCYSFRT